MPRGILLIAALTVSSAVFGQGQTPVQSTTPAPANGPFGGPLLVTPITSFPSPAPTAGITDEGRAGISDAGRAGISLENNAAGISNSANGTETTPAPTSPATTVIAPLPPDSTNQTQLNDLGVSTFVGGPSDASAPGTIGVAEVSIRYKAEKGTRNARVLGNEDVRSMLSNKNGVTMAKNMPPLGPGALEQGGQTQNAGVQTGAPSPEQSAQANPSVGQPEQNNTPSQATTASSGQNQTGAATEAENSTTPQINQNQQSNDAQGSRRLPATATFLPLLGLLGLLSGGIGFWFRKFRN